MGPIKPTTDCSLTEGTTIASTKNKFVGCRCELK
jgi:hypothetical protein